MLSQAQVVKVKKAIESMYEDTFNLIEYQEVTKANGSTGEQEVTVLENVPCRLSYSNSQSATSGEANQR